MKKMNKYTVTLTREFTYEVEAEDEDKALTMAEELLFYDNTSNGKGQDFRIKTIKKYLTCHIFDNMP